jgi:hypothetical protein
MSGQTDTQTVWSPQPGPQKALIDCPLPEVFYGGARGGGKTDGIIGKYAIKGELYGEGFNAVFFRRELPMADDAIERSKEILGSLGWRYNETKYQWRSPAGARLRFRPLERVGDAEKYQGQNLSDATVEEAGNYPDPKPIDRLNGVLRSSKGVPTQLCLTGNPGGPGQQWIKKRYIDPAPTGMKVLRRLLPSGREHRFVFIPSKLENNRALLTADPDYVNRLYLVGSDQLVKAWLDGDWNAIEGAFFDVWDSRRHVVRPFSIPDHWMRFRAMDWGSAAPFSVGWYAVAGEDHGLQVDSLTRPDAEFIIPRGALVRYREWYGTGDKLTAEEVAEGIRSRETADPEIKHGVLDPSAFAEDGGPSIAERMARVGVKWRPADNKRIARKGALGGWDQMRARLKGDAEGRSMLVFFDTCADAIRTIPVLQHDPDRPEDLDTEAEDHAADEVRYACMSRPFVRELKEPESAKYEVRGLPGSRMKTDLTVMEIIKRNARLNKRAS